MVAALGAFVRSIVKGLKGSPLLVFGFGLFCAWMIALYEKVEPYWSYLGLVTIFGGGLVVEFYRALLGNETARRQIEDNRKRRRSKLSKTVGGTPKGGQK